MRNRFPGQRNEISDGGTEGAFEITALAVSVTPRTAAGVVDAAVKALDGDDALLIAGHNLHSVYLAHTDIEFANFYKRVSVALVDGRPVLALLNRQLRAERQPRLPSTYRVGSTDWVMQCLGSPALSRVCVLGASTRSNHEFVRIAHSRAPGVAFLSVPADPWNAEALDDVADKVLAFRPQLTLIGMGMPLQESVAVALIGKGLTGVVATVGGAIDQLSGEQSNAPRWLGRVGLEWAWRLASNPRRLAHRYLIEPFKLMHVLRSKARS